MLHRALPILLLLAAPAGAEVWRADYAVSLAGVTVMEAQVTFSLAGPRYSIESRVQTRGPANLVGRGEQVTRSEGTWRGNDAVPLRYASQGQWRGSPRQVLINYVAEEPRVDALVPAEDMPRTPIAEADLRGSVDSLTALATLARRVDRTARCEGEARMFDARRLTAVSARTVGQEEEGLRCVITSRQIAGIPTNRDLEEAQRPQLTQAWFGRPQQGGPAVPMRVDLATRWWGRIEARLVRLERVS